MTHIYAKNVSDLFRHPVVYGYYQDDLMLSTELIVTLKQNFTQHKNEFKRSSGGTRISQPGGGGTPWGGVAKIIFGIILPRIAWKWKNWDGGGGRPSFPSSATVKCNSCLQCEMLPAIIIWTTCHSVKPVTVTVGKKTNKYSGTSSGRSAYWAFNRIARK